MAGMEAYTHDPMRAGVQVKGNEENSRISDTLAEIIDIQNKIDDKRDKLPFKLLKEDHEVIQWNSELDELNKKFEEEEFDRATKSILENLSDKSKMGAFSKEKAKEFLDKLVNKLSLKEFSNDFILKDLSPDEKDLIIDEVGSQMRSYILNNLYELIVKIFPNFPGLHSVKQFADAYMNIKEKGEEKIKELKMNNDLIQIKRDLSRNNRILELLYQKLFQDSLKIEKPPSLADHTTDPETTIATAPTTASPETSAKDTLEKQLSSPDDEPSEPYEPLSDVSRLRAKFEPSSRNEREDQNREGVEGGGKKKKTKRRTKGKYKKNKSKKYRKMKTKKYRRKYKT